MAGCWGANLKATLAREKWKTIWRGMLKDSNMWAPRKSHGPDQRLLKNHAWKNFEGPVNTHQHDAFNCQRFKGSLPWPTQRLHGPWNFVGAHAGIKSVGKKCPMPCRPESHKDWEYCWFWNSMLQTPVHDVHVTKIALLVAQRVYLGQEISGITGLWPYIQSIVSQTLFVVQTDVT